MTAARGVPERSLPLLLDWLDTDPAGQQQGRRVLVLGADADAVSRIIHAGATLAGSATDVPVGDSFDLVVITPEAELPSPGALAGVASLLATGGRLLLIAAIDGDDPGAVLAPLTGAGLGLVSFDDLSDPAIGGHGRWLRAVYARAAPAATTRFREARERRT